MKRVIHGLLYDTKTSEEIAQWCNNLGSSDFRHCDESLYKTSKGAYFIHGAGGALSRWSQPAGNMTGGGSGIEPLTADEALLWCEEHDADADTIQAEFPSLVGEA